MQSTNVKELLDRIRQLEEHRDDRSTPFVLAIDGRAAAGKTTLAASLAAALDAPVVHMDDFFLPPALRSEERYRTPGDNVHRERFAEEVLPFIGQPAAFTYRRFDCHAMTYGEPAVISAAPFRIVEGSYSLHPYFRRYADLTIFVTISEARQLERIAARNGAQMAQVFRERWIPLEEAYFSAFSVAEHADLIVFA